MSVTYFTLAKAITTLTKIIIKLHDKNYSEAVTEAADFGIDVGEARSSNTATQVKIRSIRKIVSRRIEKQFQNYDNPEINWDSILARVDAELDSPDLYRHLFIYLEKPEALPAYWKKKHSWPSDSDISADNKLFETLLAAVCQELTSCVGELPGFNTWLIYLVRRMVSNQQQLTVALSEWIGQQKIDELHFESHYREALLPHMDVVELFIDHPELRSEDIRQSLQIAYVTLQVGHSSNEEFAPSSIPAELLLNRTRVGSSRFLIEGKAGCGKSTLLRWFALQAAKLPLPSVSLGTNAEQDDSDIGSLSKAFSWKNRVPFFMRLRDYGTGAFPKPSEFLGSISLSLDVPSTWVQGILARGEALVLIDGLDELSPSRRDDAMKWLAGHLSEWHSDNVYVVSSRPEAVDRGFLSQTGFVSYEVRELSLDGKIELIRNWHLAVKNRLKDNPALREELPMKEARLISEIKSNRSISTLASNPLLCALLCALNRVNDGSLPENLRELCSKSIQMMLRDRDEQQSGLRDLAPVEFRECDLSLRFFVAQNLAYELVTEPDGVMSQAAAISSVRQSLGGERPCSIARARRFFDGLCQRSNLVRSCGRDSIEFVHNDLRDYLAAGRFADDEMAKDLVTNVRHRGRAKWQQILLFATGEVERRKFRNSVVEELLNHRDDRMYLDDSDIVLAMRVADQTSVPLRQDLIQLLVSFRKSLSPIDSVQKVEKFAAAGETAVPYLRFEVGRSDRVNRACIDALSKISSDRGGEAFESYLTATNLGDGAIEAVAECVGFQRFASYRNILDIGSVLRLMTSEEHVSHPALQYVENLEPLARYSDVRVLDLHGSRVRNLDALGAMRDLRDLYLHRTPVEDIRPLAGLRHLRTLYLTDTNVEGLESLRNLLWLEVLDLSGTGITHLKDLSNLDSLTTLRIDRTHITSLQPIAKLNSLQKLYISETQIDDLSCLLEMPSLQMVSIEEGRARTFLADCGEEIRFRFFTNGVGTHR